MRLVAVDLEGSGSHERERETILQIALVPLGPDLAPRTAEAFTTYVNPGRPITPRPWLPHQITDATVKGAPVLADIEHRIRSRVDCAHLVGHGVRSDWRLLEKTLPGLKPAALVDTLKLAERLHGRIGNTLTERITAAGLGPAVDALAPAAGAHDAHWDAVAAALLLRHFATELGLTGTEAIVHAAAVKLQRPPEAVPTLFD